MAWTRRTWHIGVLVGLSLAAASCSPTYRKERLVENIQQICKTEYHLDVAAKQIGHTLAVHLHHEGILLPADNHIELAPSANEILGNVIEVVHRVVLSSDASISFYLVLASDPKVPGVAFTLVRYLDDVKRANANMLTPTEFYSRTIFDLQYVGAPTFSLDQLVPTDIQFEQFLSWQLARRVQVSLTERLHAQQGADATVDMVKCAGKFYNGEFAFTLSLDPQPSDPNKPPNDELIQKVFQDAAVVIAQVLSNYHFDHFDAIRLIHPPTGRSLLLPKTRLELLK